LGLCECLGDDKINEYHYWISLVYMFKNFGMYDEIKKLSKKSKKCDNKAIQTIDKIFKNKTTPRNVKIITIGTLIEWAKADNLELTNKVFSKYYLSIKLNIAHINEITQSRYKIKIDFEENNKFLTRIHPKTTL
jgi:hypothetical protein